jgi:hypothetical protein
MVSEIIGVIYGYTFLELALDVLAVVYAYRLTKITGTFRGWLLMILAVVLITVQGSASIVSLILFFPESQLESLIASVGTGALIQGAIIGVALSASLFGAMFELYRTFKKLQTESANK